MTTFILFLIAASFGMISLAFIKIRELQSEVDELKKSKN